MQYRKIYLAVLSAGLAGISPAPFAADATLPSMVVSATRTEIDVKDSPSAVSVITGEEIEQMTVFTLDEALKNTVGVFDRRTKGFMDTTPYLVMRGLTQSKKNLVLVDGIVQNDSYNADVNWTMIDTENVERVEVLRGPFSSLYGGNAMGGVVSVFTKMPEKSGMSFKLGQGGSLDSVAPEDFRDLSVSGTLKATDTLALGLNYRKRATDGYPTQAATRAAATAMPSDVTGWETYTNTTGVLTNKLGDSGDNFYNDSNVSFKLQFAPSDVTRLNLTHSRSNSEYGYDTPNTLLTSTGTVAFPTYGTTCTAPCTGTAIPLGTFLNGQAGARGGSWDQENTGLSFRTAWNDITAKVALGHIDGSKQTVIVGTNATTNPLTLISGAGTISPATDATKDTLDVQFDVPLHDSHLLTVGVGSTRGDIDTERYNLSDWTDDNSKTAKTFEVSGSDATRALYVQDAYSINNSLTAYIGARQDWWEAKDGRAIAYNATTGAVTSDTSYEEQDASALSPKLSLVFRPTQATTYRTSIGKAFRAPTAFELFQTSVSATTVFQNNPDLEPEIVRSWEVGVDHTFENGINLVATYYMSTATDLIQTQTDTTVTPNTSTNVNVGEADIDGLELEIGGKLPYGFAWSANYTLTDTEVTENPDNPDAVGKQLTQVPKNMYNLGLDWRHDAWYVSANNRHVSKRYNQATNIDTIEGVPGGYDPYTLTDVKATFKMSDKHSASFGVNNVFDKEYFDFYQGAGRFWFAELRADY